jgi:hypothetical protein
MTNPPTGTAAALVAAMESTHPADVLYFNEQKFDEMLNAPKVKSLPKVIRFRDVIVGKGTQLQEALDAKNALQADRIYWEAEVEFQKHVQGTRWAKPKGEAEARLAEVNRRLEEQRLNEEAKNVGGRRLNEGGKNDNKPRRAQVQ